MNHKIKSIFILGITVMLMINSYSAIAQAENGEGITTDKVRLAKLQKAVEASPDSPGVHQSYIKAMGLENPALAKQYAIWMKQYPKSFMVPYAMGKAFKDDESPDARPYLLKAVEINPKFTQAWGDLWIDTERWGDAEGARTYLSKAVACDPENPDYNFYYAASFVGKDNERYRELSMAVAKKFPQNERGAQALYWLATRAKDVPTKVKYYELLKNSYDPFKFGWSASGMSGYYNLLLSNDAPKAISIAEMMAGNKKKQEEWAPLVIQAKYITEANQLIEQKKTTEATAVLAKVKLPRSASFNKELVLLKAKNDDLAGKTAAAYDTLIVAFAKNPSIKLKETIVGYGGKLGKNAEQVMGDIWKYLDDKATAATAFTLKQYLAEGSRSLEDYRGKVVLLTYWFPGCGPCRGEFPYFENVVRKFKKDELAYLGINIVPSQNTYVVPFMKSSGYSFTPLEDVKDRVKGNLNNNGAAPVNFLIDQKGRLMFSKFRTDEGNEEELELMISVLRNRKTI